MFLGIEWKCSKSIRVAEPAIYYRNKEIYTTYGYVFWLSQYFLLIQGTKD